MNTPIIGEPKSDTSDQAIDDQSIFEDKKHFPIFPTGLFQFEFKDPELNEIKHTVLPQLESLALEGKPNWMVQPKPEEVGGLKSLADLFTEATVEVLGFSGVIYEKMQVTSLRVYGVNKTQTFPAEARSNNLFAGIFIAKTNSDMRITFLDPRPQAWVIKPPVKEPNVYNSDAFSIEPKENQVLIFPSWLQYTMTFKEDVKENLWVTWTAMISSGAGAKK